MEGLQSNETPGISMSIQVGPGVNKFSPTEQPSVIIYSNEKMFVFNSHNDILKETYEKNS